MPKVLPAYTVEDIKAALLRKGYKFFEGDKDFDLNIVGVRNSSAMGEITNAFDDAITVSYSIDGEWRIQQYECTTDPGMHWCKNPMNRKGAAILKEGQYRSAYKLGRHQGRYKALVQQKTVDVYRDSNKNCSYDLDESTVERGLFGINIHRATSRKNARSYRVDKWSAGCQVIASNHKYDSFIAICSRAAAIWGNSFTYTLINSDDI